MPSDTIIIRAKQAAHFGLGRKFSRRLANREELTISKPSSEMLAAIKVQEAAGRLEILTAPTAPNWAPVRQKLKDQLHLQLGVDNTGIVVPNGAQVHKLTIGGVVFNLGDGAIDGATVTAQLDALNAALLASTDLLATGVTIVAKKLLVGTTAASGTLTSNNTNVADGVTVTIGVKVYTFRTALTPTEGEVLIGADADASLLNLIRAINHTGTPDTDYKCAGAHPQVTAAASVTSHAFAVTARVAGVAGNSIATAETSATLTWSGPAALGSGAGANAVGVIILDGSDVQDWAAFRAATSITDDADAVITYPGVATTFFTRSAVDTINAKVPVYMSYTVLQADVDRGYILLDTGLSDLGNANTRPTWTLRISSGSSPSVVTVAHDGTVTVVSSRSLLIENDGSVDFAAGHVIQLFAFGAD